MQIETHDRMRDPRRVESTQAVVRDRFGEPVVILLEPTPGVVTVLVKGDRHFDEACRQLGVRTAADVVAARFPTPPTILV